MHFNVPGKPGLHGFDIAATEGEITRDWNQTVKPRAVPAGLATKPPWHPFKDPARIWLNAEKLPYPRFEQDMRSLYQLQQAEQFIKANKDRPFAMWLNFMEPHSPYDFPIEDRDRLDPSRFAVPRVGPQDAGQIPLIFRDLSDAEKRGIIASYYTSVEYVDRNVGRALDTLRRLGLERDTLVIYHADHGYSLGQHGRFERHCGYDPALRVSLLMRLPGKIRQGVVRDLTEHIDVAPTIIDVMGIDRLPIQHGQSLRPYLETRRMDTPRDSIFSEYLENEEAYVPHQSLDVPSSVPANASVTTVTKPRTQRPAATSGSSIIKPTPASFKTSHRQTRKLLKSSKSLCSVAFDPLIQTRPTNPSAYPWKNLSNGTFALAMFNPIFDIFAPTASLS